MKRSHLQPVDETGANAGPDKHWPCCQGDAVCCLMKEMSMVSDTTSTLTLHAEGYNMNVNCHAVH